MIKCFLDLEFNLSDANAHTKRFSMECISMGACFIGENNEYLDEFYSLIKPKRNAKLGRYYANLTHLNQNEIYQAKRFNEVLDEFEQVFNKYQDVIIYTWGDEDARMLARDMKNNQYEGKLKQEFENIIDLQKIVSSSILHNNKIIKKQWALKDMQILYNNPEYKNHHNALTDAIMLKDIYIAFENNYPLNKEYLDIFIQKNLKEERERRKAYEESKINYFEPNRIETYMNIRNWKTINKEFLKKYTMIHSKYYNCKKIVVTISRDKVDIFYIMSNNDLAHLPLILSELNFRSIKRYLNSLSKTQKKDVL